MSMHEVEKFAFHKRLEQQEANALKIRDGMSKLIDAPEAAAPQTAEAVEERFPQPAQEAAPVVHEIQPDPQPQPVEKPAKEAAADPRESDPNYWRHRHLTTEGILKAERAKAQQLADEAAALRAEADRLRRETLDSRKASDAQSRERALDQIALTEYFTAKQIEEYGEEHLRTVLKGNVKAALKTIQPELQSELEQMRAEIESMRGSASQQREQKFWDDLDSGVEDWRSIQQDPDFLNWLAALDPVSGRTRDSFVKEAQKSLDAKRVVAIFKSYQDTTKPAQAPQQASRPSAPPVGKSIQAELPPPAQKLRYSDWQKFQRDMTQGVYRGREKEAAEMDRRFILAMQSGNLV